MLTFILNDGTVELDLSRWISSISESTEAPLEIYQFLDNITVDAAKVAAEIRSINFSLTLNSSTFEDFGREDLINVAAQIKRWANDNGTLSGNILGVIGPIIISRVDVDWLRMAKKSALVEVTGTIIRMTNSRPETTPSNDTRVNSFRLI